MTWTSRKAGLRHLVYNVGEDTGRSESTVEFVDLDARLAVVHERMRG